MNRIIRIFIPAVFAAMAPLVAQISQDDPAERFEYERALTADPTTGQIPANIRSNELKFASKIAANLPAKQRQAAASYFWTQRGPENIGGRTRALAQDVAQPKNLIAGGVIGGLWRSIDGGKSWARTTKNDQNLGVTAIVQDKRPGRTHVWYAGSGEWTGISAAGYGGSNGTAIVARYNGDGIFKSTDNGASWKELTATVSKTPHIHDPFDFVYRLATDPSRAEDRVYAAALGGIWMTTNGGATWILALGDTTTARMNACTDVIVSDKGVVYATLSQTDINGGTGAAKSGIYRSDDGVVWTNITPTTLTGTIQRAVPALAPGSQNILFVLGTNFLYRYDETTKTWSNRTANLPRFSGLGGNFSTQGVWNITIAVHPDDPNAVAIGGTSVYTSTDGFSTTSTTKWIGGYNPDYAKLPAPMNWRDMMYPNHHPDIHLLFFDAQNHNSLYSADDGGVHRTNEPFAARVVWEDLNTGYITGMHYTVAVQKRVPGSTAVITGLQDNNTFGSPADGKPWQWLAGGDGSYCEFLGTSNGRFATSSQGGNICFTETDSITYFANNVTNFRYSNIAGGSGERHLFVNPFILDRRNDSIVYLLTTTRIAKHPNVYSPNRTALWLSLFPQHLTALMTSGETLCSMDMTAGNGEPALALGTTRGKVFLVENLDATPSVRQISGANFPAGYVQCVAFDPEAPEKMFAVFSNYNIRSVFYTKDGGEVWTDISGNLEENPDGTGAGPSCRWIKVIRNNGKTLYLLGTSVGLFSTETLAGQATVWRQDGAASIGNAVVTMIDTRDSDGYTAVATHGRGIFTAKLNLTDSGGAGADGFQLDDCYPNPATGEYAVTRFSTPANGVVRLTLYDAIGRLVAVIRDAEAPQGIHPVRIETAALAQGVYFLHLEFQGRTRTVIINVER